MKRIKKIVAITSFTLLTFAGLTTPISSIVAEGERAHEAKSVESHSALFASLDTDESLDQKILDDHKKKIEKSEEITKQRIQEYIDKDLESQSRTLTAGTTNSDSDTPKKTYVGTYQLTAYVSTGSPCADGSYPKAGYTVASNDPSLWHKYIEIEGHGSFYVHDTGGMSSNVIDVFVSSYGEAVVFGRRSAKVYIVEP